MGQSRYQKWYRLYFYAKKKTPQTESLIRKEDVMSVHHGGDGKCNPGSAKSQVDRGYILILIDR